MMYYFKQTDREETTALLTYSKRPSKTENLTELTKEEYEAALAELLANLPEEEEPAYVPSYEEYEEAYTILTGGVENE